MILLDVYVHIIYISQFFFFASPVLSLNVDRILKILPTNHEVYIYFLSIVDVFYI